MAAELHVLKGGRPPGEPDEDIIALIEGWLGEAKAGKIHAVAYAIVKDDESQTTGWLGIRGTRYTLHAALAMLAQRYTFCMGEGD